MTTQELKQYIDKVLGNNLRCLLPSYWWKRLFHHVVDRIDEVEQSASELIEASKMPIVETVDELNKLDLPKGSVAAVEKTGESATVKISDCYLSSNLKEDWDKYTIVKGVEEKDVIIDKDVSVAVALSASKEGMDKDTLQITAISGIFYYIKFVDGEARYSSLEEVNKALSSGKYRAIFVSNGSDDYSIDDYFTFYLEKPQPSLFIKGDSWERLAKESDLEGVGASITVDSELSDTSENPVQNKVIYENLYGMNQQYIQMYEEQNRVFTNAINNVNTELLKKVDYVAGKQLSTEDFTTALKAKLESLNNYDDTSIRNAVNSLTTQINTLVSGDASAAIESFNEIIAFLNGVEDSESLDSIIASIEQQIASVQSSVPTKTSQLTNDSGFLTQHQDISTLATKEEVNAKQDTISDLDTIRSGAALGATAIQSVKTINGESILGEGNIVVNVDTSNLATKEELQNIQNEVIANEEVVAAAFNDVNERINAISENVGGITVTKEEFESTVETINQTISDNKSATDVTIEGLETSIGNVDAKFADYATTESFNGAIETINNTIVENEEITAAAINDLNTRLAALEAAIANL